MNTIQEKRSIQFGGLAISVLLPFTVSLLLFYLLLKPPVQDFSLMVQLMGATMLVSILVAFAAYRLGWLTAFTRLQASLVLVYALAGALVFLNVWVTARMMFASQHDLMLATVLLVFASGIAMAITYFLTSALTERIQVLEQAAGRIAAGELTTRVRVSGRDEMGSLANSFNQMASQLEASHNHQRELESMRRNLVAWVGHDLRTPLTSIRAILEAVGDGVVEDPAQVQRYLRTAQQDIRSLSRLIDDLFELSQMDAGGLRIDCQPNALGDLISDTMESFSELAQREGVVLVGNIEPEVDPVVMDAPRIGRVLANLVSNALRYTTAGGQVTIHARREAQGVEVTISDTGEGIPAADLPYIFDQFYRGEKSRSRQTGGAGLGLAIARGIVLAHGGTIQAESQVGQGTRVIFKLPSRETDCGHAVL